MVGPLCVHFQYAEPDERIGQVTIMLASNAPLPLTRDRTIVAPSREQLLAILVIAHDFSGRLGQLIDESAYQALRPHIEQSQLFAILQAEPAIVEDWSSYSQDKRTSSGWGFGSSQDGGWLVDGPDGIRKQFTVREEACASFVLHELDFWAAVEAKQTEKERELDVGQ